MNELEPLPPHVLIPTEDDMDAARRLGLGMPPRVWKQSQCPVCSGTRQFAMWSGAPITSELVKFRCPCEDQMALDRWMGVRGIDRRYRQHRLWDATGLSVSGTDWTVKWLQDVATNVRYGNGALLYGPPGSGKTLAATLVLKEAMRIGISGRFFATATIHHLDQWSNQEFRAYWESKVRPVSMLVIDQLGSEKNTVKLSHEIEGLIRHRTANGLSTIITTNLTPDEISNHHKGGLLQAITDVCDVVEIAREREFDYPAVRTAEQRLGISRPVVFR